MTTLREAAQQALLVLESGLLVSHSSQVVTALRAALAEPEPQEIADLRQACQEGWRYADELDQERKRLEEALRAALAEPVQEPWIRVIDEAMVTHHIGVADPADDYETAKRKLNNLLCHTQDIGAYFAKQAEPVQEPTVTVYGIKGQV